MRLLSLTVRNYRIHREVTVAFDRARTLLGGPNQSGKSTLAEAAHRVLFLRAKTGGAVQVEMVSKLHMDHPEVALDFEAGGGEWRIEKRFAGTKGTARLSGPGGIALKDDEAETKLSELLQSELAGGRGGAKLGSLWAHLWVWQGCSGDDPGEHAGRHKDTLVRRLQQDGVAAVMQSAIDQMVRDRIAVDYLALYTPASGKLKATSPPELARAQCEAAEAALTQTTEALKRLERAVDEHAKAGQQLADAEAALPGLQKQLLEAEAKLQEVAALRQQEEAVKRTWEAASAVLKGILDQDTRIRELQGKIAAAREALQPAEAGEARLFTAEQEAAKLAREAEQALRDKAESIRRTRQLHDFAAAAVAVFEKDAACSLLTGRTREAAAVEKERQDLQARLAKLPVLTAQDLKGLRKLDQEAGQARAALQAMATGIELLASDLTVTVDGVALPAGEARILTDTAELVIGGGTRLRIQPGGGTSLAEARARSQGAERAFAEALGRHALANLDEAIAAQEQRQSLEGQAAQLLARWKAMGGESLATELAAASSAVAVAKAELERRRTTAPEPADLAGAQQLHAAQREELQRAEEAEGLARRADEQARKRRDAALKTLEEQREKLARDRQALRDLEIAVQVQEKDHGSQEAREKALLEARGAERETALQLDAVKKSLAGLSPDLLTADRDRFQRAIKVQEDNRRSAQDARLSAATLLKLDGSSDPQADLLHATARLDAARRDHDHELRRAKAIEKLHKLFASSGEAIDRSLVQPLADRVSGYIQCLYGPGAEVRIALTDDGVAELELLCPGMPAFGFDTLSGGTREQVAAALRLAMAEILAADHDGCLPLLFDDAFAYADPERVQVLQRMLDLAAARGLQVIVLACNPGDYSGLGAVEVRVG
ncbi:AAA family ATPase [Luteolibacter sp. Populi]|uniref:AAA family ATPase n=1 Tax=Luteolibacter sp. Populi TaxID=3230487 RepID=UPI0034660615